MKILALYCVLASLLAVVQLVFAMKGINNLWTVQFFCPIQFSLLMLLYHSWIKQPVLRKITLFSIPAFIAGWALSSFWFGNLNVTLAYADPITAVLLVLVSSYVLLKIDRSEVESALSMPAFWASSGIIIYFGGTVVLSTLHTSLLKASIDTMRLAWSTQAVLNILANLLYAGAFLCLRPKT